MIDEPLFGYDIFTRRNFLKLICDSLITDKTIVIAAHMVDEIENFIDRAVLLENGHLIRDVMIEDMQADSQSLEELMKKVFHYDEDRFKNMFYNG